MWPLSALRAHTKVLYNRFTMRNSKGAPRGPGPLTIGPDILAAVRGSAEVAIDTVRLASERTPARGTLITGTYIKYRRIRTMCTAAGVRPTYLNPLFRGVPPPLIFKI